MKLKKALLLIIFPCLVYHKLHGENIISLYIKPYPLENANNQSKNIVDKLKDPGHVAKKTIKAQLNHEALSGLFIMYAGYLTIPDPSGQIIFPRKHEAPKVYLMLTTKIIPIPMAGNTMADFMFDPKVPTEFYQIEQKQDKETNLFYWQVESLPLPKDNIIPRTTIIILEKPTKFYVPTGITLTNNSTNLILPDIYFKKGLNTIENGLYILNLKHLFGHINYLYKGHETGYSQLIQY